MEGDRRSHGEGRRSLPDVPAHLATSPEAPPGGGGVHVSTGFPPERVAALPRPHGWVRAHCRRLRWSLRASPVQAPGAGPGTRPTQQPAPRRTLVSPRMGRPRFLGLAPASPLRSTWGFTDPAGFGGAQGNSVGDNAPTTAALPTGHMKILQSRSNLCNPPKNFPGKETRRPPASSTKLQCFRGGRA